MKYITMNKRTAGFWLSTSLLAADQVFAGTAALLGAPFMRDLLQHLGYPSYFLAILGPWKLLGALAILVPGRPRLKEWAYAGMFFDLTGAGASHLISGDGAGSLVPMVLLLGLLFASWSLRPASHFSRFSYTSSAAMLR
jgi:hypothetical protein